MVYVIYVGGDKYVLLRVCKFVGICVILCKILFK